MPRQRSRSTDPEVRDRNTRDILGRPGLAGMVRTGGARGSGRDRVASAVQQPLPDVTGSAQLLVLSATGDSIATGGDFVEWDTIVAQHGFEGFAAPSGAYWAHPISGVYMLTYEHAWDTYTGGGDIYLEVDGVLLPEGVLASGTSGSAGRGTIAYRAAEGATGRIYVDHADPSAQTCNATVHVAIPDPDQVAEVDAGTVVETLWFDTRVGSLSGAVTLDAGITYTLLIDGNARIQPAGTIDEGTTQAVRYPSSGQSASNEGQIDYDTLFATDGSVPSASLPQHYNVVELNTGSGWSHVEPDGGPFSTPQAGNIYSVTVVGEGLPIEMRRTDPALTDNNGMFRVRVVI